MQQNHFIPIINLDFLKDKILEKKIKVQLQEVRKIRRNFIFYRGYAFTTDELEYLLEHQKKKNFEILYLNGEEAYKRIKFGQENQTFDDIGINERISDLYEFTYCSDCKVSLGEYHLYSYSCDLEICPHCGGQLISCECNFSVTKSTSN